MNFSEFNTNYRRIINKNIKASGESLEYFSEYKVKVLDKFFKRNDLSKNIKLLDLGCGTGELLYYIFIIFQKSMPTDQIFAPSLLRGVSKNTRIKRVVF